MTYLIAGLIIALSIWVAAAVFWASSVAKHNPELRESAGSVRYGWRCPRCSRMEAPSCKVNKCGGALVWVQRGTRIKCSRCHRNYVASPLLFRQVPGPKRMTCRQCGWSGTITDWRVD